MPLVIASYSARRFITLAGALLMAGFISTPRCETTPAITVLAPNGGERLIVGDHVHLRWTEDSARVGMVELSMSCDSGAKWTNLLDNAIAAADSNWNDCVWVIRDTLIDNRNLFNIKNVPILGKELLFKVNVYGMLSINDISDSFFVVVRNTSTLKEGAISSRALSHNIPETRLQIIQDIPKGAAAFWTINGRMARLEKASLRPFSLVAEFKQGSIPGLLQEE
jgi:hypothetical protein